jgi:hypothetical protein
MKEMNRRTAFRVKISRPTTWWIVLAKQTAKTIENAIESNIVQSERREQTTTGGDENAKQQQGRVVLLYVCYVWVCTTGETQRAALIR